MFYVVYFPVRLYSWVCVCARARLCAAEPPRWQGLSIMINRQTRQLSHTITLHYSSQDLKVKTNGSSSIRTLHISLFFFSSFSCLHFHVENVLLSWGSLSFCNGLINWQMVDAAASLLSIYFDLAPWACIPRCKRGKFETSARRWFHLQRKWQVLNVIIIRFVAPTKWNEP